LYIHTGVTVVSIDLALLPRTLGKYR